jgi:hypothetical protein
VFAASVLCLVCLFIFDSILMCHRDVRSWAAPCDLHQLELVVFSCTRLSWHGLLYVNKYNDVLLAWQYLLGVTMHLMSFGPFVAISECPCKCPHCGLSQCSVGPVFIVITTWASKYCGRCILMHYHLLLWCENTQLIEFVPFLVHVESIVVLFVAILCHPVSADYYSVLAAW